MSRATVSVPSRVYRVLFERWRNMHDGAPESGFMAEVQEPWGWRSVGRFHTDARRAWRDVARHAEKLVSGGSGAS